jgi:restriction system protein
LKSLRDDFQWLRGEDGVVDHSQAVEILARLLAPLLSAEGFELFAPDGPGLGVDLVAGTPTGKDRFQVSVAIEYKHHGQGCPIGVDTVRELMGAAAAIPYDRAPLIGRFGFTAAAREHARRLEPISIELMDLAGIEAWIHRYETGQPRNAHRVQLLIQSISHEFAQLVARHPETLDYLEWRDLERMMARVMEGLGFKTTLTPPSKDGGKDLVLICSATDGVVSQIC